MKIKLFLYSEEDKVMIMKHLECTEDGLKEDVDAILDWFEKQPHLAEAGIDPAIVRTFLLMNKGSREKTKQRIDNFYKYRGLAPDLIQTRIGALSSDKDIWTYFRQAAMPKLYDGRRVTLIQFIETPPSAFTIDELFRNLYMIMDIRVRCDCFRGDIWIIDAKNATLAHAVRINPLLVQKAISIFQEGLGLKVQAIHVLNFPSIGYQVINLFRKFVKAKIMDRLMIHSSLEELYKVIPKQYLPKDYGGENYTMQEFKDMYQKEVRSEPTKQFLLDACRYVSDEKKRDGINSEVFLAGTFKKLDLD